MNDTESEKIASFFDRIKNENTYFFHNDDFEEKSEKHIKQIINLLLQLKEYIDNKELSVNTVSDWITTDNNTLTAILTLIGLSKETFLRLISFIRIINDKNLNMLVDKNEWKIPEYDDFKEWGEKKILGFLKSNKAFREGIVNLLFWGSTKDAIVNNLPLFEHSKLTINKFRYNQESFLDTIVRYKYKGSYAANKGNNPENLIINLLNSFNIKFTSGKLDHIDRLMDFIIPSKDNPKIIIESSYVVTTSSGQGDKAKTEQSVYKDIKTYYPNSLFFGFIDGMGWLVREGDLKRMVSAYDDVFTFKENELDRFSNKVKKIFGDIDG